MIYIFIMIILFICFWLPIGEKIVSLNENSLFSKWWRKHICSPDPYEP